MRLGSPMAFGLVAFGLMLLPVVVSGQTGKWTPPEPSPQSKDWIKLTSGEWLKGEMKSKRDQTVVFDSDELDLLEIDWDDIAEIRSPRIETYVFEGRVIVAGPATMKDGVIRIRVGDEVQEFPRASLLSIVEGRPSEWNYWSIKGSLGIVGRAGNTDQSDLNAVAIIRRDSPKNRLDLSYTGNIGEIEGQENVNNHRLNAGFNLFLYRNLFITPLAAQAYADKFQNIKLQYTLSLGLGYFFARNKKVEFYVALEGGYTKTENVSVEEGQSPLDETGVALPLVGFEWDITDDIELRIDYNSQISVPDAKNSIHHLVALFSLEVWRTLDFTISSTLDRVENPTPREDGTVPEPDDLRIAFGLGLDL